jgi:hypothetical protein
MVEITIEHAQEIFKFVRIISCLMMRLPAFSLIPEFARKNTETKKYHNARADSCNSIRARVKSFVFTERWMPASGDRANRYLRQSWVRNRGIESHV